MSSERTPRPPRNVEGAHPPPSASLAELHAAVGKCRGCDLWRNSTQAVFGEGPADARALFVGEQPGDVEDREGRPFVGPAGRLLRRAMAAVGIDPGSVYVTNAVKHFKWEPRGKRRLHSRPSATEVRACHPWLEAEMAALRPEVIVCLGATAVQALVGTDLRIGEQRGRWLSSPLAPGVLVTIHPSAVLREETDELRARAFARLVADLRVVADRLAGRPHPAGGRP